MQVITVKSVKSRVNKARKLILSAGHAFGGVHFIKRSDGSRRRMCYRLHVQTPTYARKPSGKGKRSRKPDLLTVFDTNKIRYNRRGLMCGRGDFRTIPLDGVYRVAVGGEIYKLVD